MDSIVDVLFLTTVAVESQAVSKFLQEKRRWKDELTGTIYTLGEFNGLKMGLRRIFDQGNVAMASETERAIHLLKPQVIFLVGIAGGRKKLNIGDVVIVTRTCSYESGKETKEEFRFREKGGRFNYELLQQAIAESEQSDWLTMTSHKDSKYKVKDGAIASGEKVVTTSKTELMKIIQRHCEDTIAVEMEGVGLSTVLYPYPKVKGLNIRGISDLIDGKDQIYDEGYRELAAENASAFAFHLIKQLGLTPSRNVAPTTASASAVVEPDVVAEKVKKIRNFIRLGRMSLAFDAFFAAEEYLFQDIISEVEIQKHNYEELKRKVRMRIISTEKEILETNKIAASFLESLGRMKDGGSQ